MQHGRRGGQLPHCGASWHSQGPHRGKRLGPRRSTKQSRCSEFILCNVPMPGEFERRFAAAIGGFARERSLTPEFISATLQRDGVLDQSAKRTLKAILTITKDCQGRGRLGTLRASILTGTTLLGP